jgi:hypothetical protein
MLYYTLISLDEFTIQNALFTELDKIYF